LHIHIDDKIQPIKAQKRTSLPVVLSKLRGICRNTNELWFKNEIQYLCQPVTKRWAHFFNYRFSAVCYVTDAKWKNRINKKILYYAHVYMIND